MPNIDLRNCKTAFDNRLWTINITTDFSRFFVGYYDTFIVDVSAIHLLLLMQKYEIFRLRYTSLKMTYKE